MPVFQPVDPKLNFPQAEAAVLKFWKDRDIFHKSLKQREGSPYWCFYEGPPTANGKPHPGHVLTRVVKDLFPRYKTMCGCYVPRKAGWDTHGLPVEIEVEKELKLNGKAEVEKYGVEPFVRKCMESVFRYTNDWEQLTDRIGFWIDLDTAYVTYHQSYVESVWWSLKELHARGLLYRGHKILPWCPHCQTALSSHEVGLGYQQVEDPSVYITFRDVDWEQNKTSFLAWTTTPWTLPSNAALAVKADTEYSYVNVAGETLIMASALVGHVMGKMQHEVVKKEMGSALVGRKYQPLFDWFIRFYTDSGAARAAVQHALPVAGYVESMYRVHAADFVTLDTGSGIVHVAPAYGADDYALSLRDRFPLIHLVGTDGCFIDMPTIPANFQKRFVKDADNDIVKELREKKLLLRREGYKHDYPFCWRCDTPLIYFARGGWFIRTTQEIAHVIENNKQVDWHPEHIRDGRFGSFLETNIDWALSRERYWGTPLNIWCCACGNEEAVASFADLKSKPGAKGLDAFDRAKQKEPGLNDHLRVHKPWIDEATFACSKCGKDMQRTKEVIDCWYDSGAMPFAQWGYPHAPGSKEQFARAFPADFISEAIDQTRGWFYSLIAESTLLADSFAKTSGKQTPYPHPYKTCLVLGHVCDEKGEKMSKSKGNYLDPNAILAEEGADALRWFFYSTNNPWTSSRFSRAAVRDAQKEFLVKLRNVYSFFVIYANIDDFEPSVKNLAVMCTADEGFQEHAAKLRAKGLPTTFVPLLDRWIASELELTTRQVRKCLDAYDIYDAAQALNAFVESLSNWWLRRSRDRFWSSWRGADKLNAQDLQKLSAHFTLHQCLVSVAKLAAPFIPFFAEEMYQNLTASQRASGHFKLPESVHLCDYPKVDEAAIDEALAKEIALVREVASLGRAARSGAKLKTRQPLAKVVVVTSDPAQDEIVRKHEQVILDELNVKAIEIAHQADQYVGYELKPNFKVIGAKHRELVPAIKAALATADATAMRGELDAGRSALLNLEGGKHVWLTADEVKVSLKAKEGYAAAGAHHIVVVLDTHLTPELLEEGVARELVNRINGWRGDLNLKYEQRIRLALQGSAKLEAVARKFTAHICGETLATELKVGDTPAGWQTLAVDVDGEQATLALATA
jgi:isoleucyl-tRNA synthetase